MREIKFRAWDKSKDFGGESRMIEGMSLQDWIYNRQLDYTDGMMTQLSDFDDWETELIFMQYTGLKDKNDREIYEGDIIQGLHDYGPGGWINRKGQITWDNIRGYRWQYWLLDTLEVIGNIYENPELLEVENGTN